MHLHHIRFLIALLYLVGFTTQIELSAQGFVHYPPLLGGAAYGVMEQPNGLLKIFGNHNNYSFNAQATLSNYQISPQGVYLGVGDSLRNSSTDDYWLWLPEAEELITFRKQLPLTAAVQVERFRTDSSTIYKRTINFPGADSITFANVKEMANGDLFAFATVDTNSTIYSPDLYCMRLNAVGDVIWSSKLLIFPGQNITVDAFTSEVKELPNGDIVMVLMADSKPMFVRLKGDGTVVFRFFQQNIQLAANPVAAIANNGSMFLTYNDAVAGALYLLSLDANAQVIWQKDLRSVFAAEVDVPGTYQVIVNKAGNVFFAGTMLVDGIDRKLILAEFSSANGNLIRKSSYSGMADSAVRLFGSTLLKDGSLVFSGTHRSTPVVIKVDASGQVFDGALNGRVAIDLNDNCIASTTEPPVKSWLIEAKSVQNTYYSYTDQQGNYQFENLDSAQYVLRVKEQNYTWESCPDSVVVNVAHDTVITNIAVKSVSDCAVLKLDIAASFIRYCTPNTWQIQYRNYGSDTARNVRIELVLDPVLQYQTSSITPASLIGKTVNFLLPDLLPSEGGRFQVTATMDCSGTSPGRHICMRGNIYPDTLCVTSGTSWNGGMVEAIPFCQNDTVKFALINNGKQATGTFDYIIIEDYIVLRQVPISLNPKEVRVVEEYADNGETIRLIADQIAGHPLAINPTVAVEGCTGSSMLTKGILNQLPNQTGSPFSEIFCDEIIASLDPNDKRAFPIGYESDRKIDRNTPIEYMIRFQNTGNDTAFRVVIIDTLSAFLDASTVRPGASSHPYRFTPSANNTLVFTFDPIALPDSNKNEPASNGFVQFWVNQKLNVPYGSHIRNEASIYFDVNDPVVTNMTDHLVKPISVDADEPHKPLVSLLQISPNPTKHHCMFQWKGAALHKAQYKITDLSGRVVATYPYQDFDTEIKQIRLDSGVYFVSLESRGYVFAVEKWTIID
jgi:uncharacterized repeat protein (TIGR01451 family)